MSVAKHRPKHSTSPPPRPSYYLWGLAGLALVAAAFVCFSYFNKKKTLSKALQSLAAESPEFFNLEPEAKVYGQYGGSAGCLECHKEAAELWKHSNHALAERPMDLERDRRAFEPPRRFKHGTQTTDVRLQSGRFEIVALGISNRAPLRSERVIGNHPLLQYLVPAPGGRWQTHEASYDPVTNEWFNVYGDEDRQPGEWGHWTGRGMNWNTMCAACHNTRLRKNYDETNDAFNTTMVEMGVGCEACHGPMKDHTDWQNKFKGQNRVDPTLKKISRERMMETCAFCHTRRSDLTGDFKPGDAFLDHHFMSGVDETDTYFPDGQIRDEDYEYTAFLGSRMHDRGVVCMDCHNPHSMKTILPGNLLCQRCHEGSHTNAPIIDAVKHSFHKVFNPGIDTNGQSVEIDLINTDFKNVKETGGQCVNCHMPQTPYMQRHWRHDHGFTVPDPLLTKKYGIPNACNRCHQEKEKGVDWAMDYVQKWYGNKMDRPYRRRTEVFVKARQGDVAAVPSLLSILNTDTNYYWRSVAADLLEQFVQSPQVRDALLNRLNTDSNALVRGHAIQSLARFGDALPGDVSQAIQKALADPVRSVRYQAASVMRGSLNPDLPVSKEYRHALEFNADQPMGQMQKGAYFLSRNNHQQALEHFQKAARWDPFSAPIRHELAVLLSMMGRVPEALQQMREAVRLAPREAEYRYKLALALNEAGDLAGTVSELEQAVKLDPRHVRSWYNLGLAKNAQNDSFGALEALGRAESIDPSDPRIPYASATILVNQRKFDAARSAAKRALQANPNFSEAQALLQSLPR